MSSVRYRIWRELRVRHEPRVISGGVDVTRTVAPYAVSDVMQRCASCSYRCKKCYHDAEATNYEDAPSLAAAQFYEFMASSEWCIIARGDTPHTSKLTEAVLAGCLPAIVIDGALPYENDVFNFSSASVRLPTEVILNQPARLLDAIRAVSPARRASMREYLHSHRRLFEYGRRDGGGAEATIVDAMVRKTCDRMGGSTAESSWAIPRPAPRARGRRRRHGQKPRLATGNG